MFKELGQMASLMKHLPKIKEEWEKFQLRLGQIIAEGDAGGRMVVVRVNGKLEVLACALSDDALQMNDREVLEDMIRAATNQAIMKVRQQTSEEAGRIFGALGLPPGLSIPGL